MGNIVIETVTFRDKDKFVSYIHNAKGPAIRSLVSGKEHSKVYITKNKHHSPNTEEGKSVIELIENGGYRD